jgi:hypothetical protein
MLNLFSERIYDAERNGRNPPIKSETVFFTMLQMEDSNFLAQVLSGKVFIEWGLSAFTADHVEKLLGCINRDEFPK